MKFPKKTRTQGNFNLAVESGEATGSEIIVMLGENGTGKTIVICIIYGSNKDNTEVKASVPNFNVMHKPQNIQLKFPSC